MLKNLVQFDFHNLKTEFLPRRNDAIFCRNVMIYFDAAEQRRLIDEAPPLSEPGRLSVCGPRGELVRPYGKISHRSTRTTHGVPAHRKGGSVTFPSDQHASELLEVFFESAEEILQGMNRAGLALEENPGDLENLRHVRRAVHTLKGDSAACGFRELSELAHRLEDVLTPEIAAQKARGNRRTWCLPPPMSFQEMLAALPSQCKRLPRRTGLRELIEQLLQRAQSRLEPPAFAREARVDRIRAAADWRGLPAGRARLSRGAPFEAGQARLAAVGFELARKALESAGRVLAFKPTGIRGATTKLRYGASRVVDHAGFRLASSSDAACRRSWRSVSVEAWTRPHPVGRDASASAAGSGSRCLSAIVQPEAEAPPSAGIALPEQRCHRARPFRNVGTSSLRVEAASNRLA